VVHLLLGSLASQDIENVNGDTALKLATRNGHEKVIDELIAAEAVRVHSLTHINVGIKEFNHSHIATRGIFER
jgi:ankyrin repeat protein